MTSTKIFIDLEASEICEFKKKVDTSGLTQREFVLEALNIPYTKRTLGRPKSTSLDEATKTLHEKMMATREADVLSIKKQLVVKCDEQEKLDSVFEVQQAKRRAR